MRKKYVLIIKTILIVFINFCFLQQVLASKKENSSELNNESPLKTVIGGSYRKHLKTLMQLKKNLQNEGILVLSPVGELAINPNEEFVVLDADPVHDPRILQDSIFAKIRASSFHVVANVGGYIGSAAKLEMGYAIAHGIQILTLEPIDDPNLAPYCRLITEVFPNILSNI